jgi:hypothetical protein
MDSKRNERVVRLRREGIVELIDGQGADYIVRQSPMLFFNGDASPWTPFWAYLDTLEPAITFNYGLKYRRWNASHMTALAYASFLEAEGSTT